MRRSPARGAALLIVLWLLLLLGLVVLGLNRGSQLLAGESGAAVGAVQARWAARAGLEQVLERLETDLSPEDGPADAWWDDPEAFEEVELAPGFAFTVSTPGLAEGSVRFGPADLSGRLPINAATLGQIDALPTVSEENAGAIVDWRDANDDPSPGGAERAAYDALELPTDIRNGPFRTVAELRLVEGVDGFAYAGDPAAGVAGLADLTTPYSYDPDTTPSGQEKIRLDRLEASTLRERYRFTRGLADAVAEEDDVRSVFDLVGLDGGGGGERGEIDEIGFQWAADRVEDFVAADDADEERGPGRVNVNTAPLAVLEAILGPDVAADVAAGRTSAGFASLGDLTRQSLVPEDDFEAAAAGLTVRSRVFGVTSSGTAPGGRTATLRAVVDRGAAGERPVVRWLHDR
ncbi:type II secretion system minor pseudopilin [Phycisphaera mikurensis]|uniref:General secretion pathway protein K n=1 Tax=Phycisphaera mikurensis (strain NBRC 102666 / KCTC 22515 / FYK2301M01) TaxID=1142394 RepID=I0IE70_PHYMF|nr:type II secretion system protein GspK [Phycisphaera mikurensis]MBB6441360.1 general secretion pathway protein K [Phycisphaera mikurensis]BAM03558.1 hypothetical protein PSMK_13990 [Phycisphaera mikurensis NBRC 102666]